MRLPRSIVINGKRWTVVRKSLWRRGLFGQCNYRKREIQIDSQLNKEETLTTFLHEIAHACLPEVWPERLEEAIVERVTSRLFPVLHSMGWMR